MVGNLYASNFLKPTLIVSGRRRAFGSLFYSSSFIIKRAGGSFQIFKTLANSRFVPFIEMF